MVKREISKFHLVYHQFKCDPNIKIPMNDVEAWLCYPEYRWIYNRLYLSELQNIDSAPMPILPSRYPVILKPIINLYGMGLHVFKINDQNEFQDHWYSNDFWMEYLTGKHLSIDIFLIKGKIQGYYAFQGYPLEANLGSFRYWENTDILTLPDACQIIINKLANYTGCVNLELIGDKIIEGHLRLGDVTKLPDEKVVEGIISIYQGVEYDFPKKISKTYLFPIWIFGNRCQIFLDNLDLNVVETICHRAYAYQVDHGTEANPSNLHRLMMITSLDYEIGLEIVNELYSYIHSF